MGVGVGEGRVLESLGLGGNSGGGKGLVLLDRLFYKEGWVVGSRFYKIGKCSFCCFEEYDFLGYVFTMSLIL